MVSDIPNGDGKMANSFLQCSSCVAHWFRFQFRPGSSILGQCGSESGFRDLIIKYLTILQKKITHIVLVNKCKYKASMKDFQASEEVSSSQKRRSQTILFSLFVGHFCLTGTGSSSTMTKINADPDPQHSF